MLAEYLNHTLNIKRRVPSILAFKSGYRQATFTYNKHGTVHAIERELSYCLSSYVVNIGGIRFEENKS